MECKLITSVELTGFGLSPCAMHTLILVPVVYYLQTLKIPSRPAALIINTLFNSIQRRIDTGTSGNLHEEIHKSLCA